MKVQVNLHGILKHLGTASYTFDASSVSEIINALSLQLEGFTKTLREGSWHIILDKNKDISIEEINVKRKFQILDILPAIDGSGGGLQILGGAALIGAAFFTGGTSLAFLGPGLIGAGVSLVAGGVMSMFAPQPSAPDYESQQVAKNASNLFDGPRNRAATGIPVPIVIGEVITGAVTISSQLTVDNTVVS